MSVRMRAAILLLSLSGLSAASVFAETSTVQTPPQVAAPAAPAETDACAPGDQLACSCPAGANIGVNDLVTPCFLGDVNRAIMTQSDPFANNVFSALNWPKAEGRGVPDYAAEPNAARADGNTDYVTVWDSWPDARALFRPDGQAPQDWETATTPLPEACSKIALAEAQATFGWAQVPAGAPVHLLDDYIDPDGNALIDRAGRPVRYEVFFNQQAYSYVTQNALWDARRLAAYLGAHDRLDFPKGQWDHGDARGSIVIKAAWKILDQGQDDPKHFHKSWAFVSPVIGDGKVLRDTCELRPVGLIGLHIAIKTANFPDWLWTTFDHVASAPAWADIPAIAANTSNPYAQFGEAQSKDDEKTYWMFFTPQKGECLGDCRTASLLNKGLKVKLADTTVSTLPSRLIQIQPRGYYFSADPAPRDCDLVRKSDVGATNFVDPSDLVELRSYHDMDCLMNAGFGGTALQYYQLKGAQWFTSRARVPVPDVLANTVLEAFSQANSSCLSCHGQARPKGEKTAAAVYDYIFAVGHPGIAAVADTETTPPSANGN